MIYHNIEVWSVMIFHKKRRQPVVIFHNKARQSVMINHNKKLTCKHSASEKIIWRKCNMGSWFVGGRPAWTAWNLWHINFERLKRQAASRPSRPQHPLWGELLTPARKFTAKVGAGWYPWRHSLSGLTPKQATPQKVCRPRIGSQTNLPWTPLISHC